MKFRTGVIIGLAAGYVMGAKAGRERYEQIQRAFSTLSETSAVQAARAKGREAVGAAGDAARSAASNGFQDAAQRVRDAVDRP